MKSDKGLIFAILMLAAGMNHSVAADFPIIKISKETHTTLLIGSTHSDTPSESNRNDAATLVRKSKAVCLEQNQKDGAGIAKTANAVFLNQGGQTLSDRLGKSLYDDSKKHLEWFLSAGKSIDNVSPYVVSNLLVMQIASLRDLLVVRRPENSLDEYIRIATEKYKKDVFAIESSDAVANSFLNISDAQWRYYIGGIVKMLDCQSCTKTFSDNMVLSYSQKSDFEAVDYYFHKAFSFDRKLGAIYDDALLEQRNINMAKAIEAEALDRDKCDIVAVGIGHLGGRHGIVSLLKKRGLIVDVLHALP